MPDLGIDVLFKGTNMLRLLGGLWVAARISLISIVISMPLGILVGAFMTMKNKIVRAICRIYHATACTAVYRLLRYNKSNGLEPVR